MCVHVYPCIPYCPSRSTVLNGTLATVWYEWTATHTGVLVIDLDGSSTFGYTGLGSNTDDTLAGVQPDFTFQEGSCRMASQQSWLYCQGYRVVAGRTYIIVVISVASEPSETYVIAAVASDDCLLPMYSSVVVPVLP